jgi:hypothetical protein
MNQKEAFRQLSHRFHGKGSGKKKTEKRQKKVEEEQVLFCSESHIHPQTLFIVFVSCYNQLPFSILDIIWWCGVYMPK